MSLWNQGKLEPGMLCLVVGARLAVNNGKTVTLVKPIMGHPAAQTDPDTGQLNRFIAEPEKDYGYWEVDGDVYASSIQRENLGLGPYSTCYLKGKLLMPIDGHEEDEQDVIHKYMEKYVKEPV